MDDDHIDWEEKEEEEDKPASLQLSPASPSPMQDWLEGSGKGASWNSMDEFESTHREHQSRHASSEDLSVACHPW